MFVFHIQDSYLLDTFGWIEKIYAIKCESQIHSEGEEISTNSTSVPASIGSPAVIERWAGRDSCSLGVHNYIVQTEERVLSFGHTKKKKTEWWFLFQRYAHRKKNNTERLSDPFPRWWLYFSVCPIQYRFMPNFPAKLFFKDFVLFIFRERRKEGEREGEKHQCVVASHVPPNWGPGLQPRHVPWLGIKLAMLWFTG